MVTPAVIGEFVRRQEHEIAHLRAEGESYDQICVHPRTESGLGPRSRFAAAGLSPVHHLRER